MEHQIRGLYLLHLLVHNRIAEFHVQVELIPAKVSPLASVPPPDRTGCQHVIQALAHIPAGGLQLTASSVGEQVQQSPQIAHVIQLEQWMMEGAYNKVLDAVASPADAFYSSYLSQLQDTVRRAWLFCASCRVSGTSQHACCRSEACAHVCDLLALQQGARLAT